jgi:GNAT superfamily N-acetyltransferase
MEDHRIAPVEDNLDAFFEYLIRTDGFESGSDPDVSSYWSDIPFPLFNAIGAARFAPGTVEARAREVVAPYLDRGLPFMWWATPSGHAVELEPVLTGLGLRCEPIPGMFRPLDGPIDVRIPPGVTLEQVGDDDLVSMMLPGFGMPEQLRAPLLEFVAALPPEQVGNLVATLDGEAVACGTVWQTGTTAGLYNIATLEEFRGRGIGYAVTAALLDLGHERGATQAILHSSPIGRPVYERLGFEQVCLTPQFLWMPAASDEGDPEDVG